MPVNAITMLGRRLTAHPGAQNFSWLVIDKGLRLLVALGVGSWVARYLGAGQFGLFAYASALIAIVSGIAGLGMDALVVRDIIQQPGDARKLLGTAMAYRITGAIAGTISILGLVTLLRPGEYQVWGLVALLGLGAIVQSLESGEQWFQARIQMRSLVLPRMALFLCITSLKIWLVLHGAGLVLFVAVSALEFALGGCLTFAMVWWGGAGAGRLEIDWHRGLALLRECWPLAVSGFVVVLYMKVSQLMLAGLLDDMALGIYSAAIRLTEAANFIPTVLASSLLPSMLQHRNKGADTYRRSRLRFFRLNALLALSIAVPLSIGAPWIVRLLYGPHFSEASPVLAVHAWTLVFVFLGVARGQHLLNERQTHWALRFTIWGLLINVGLSLWLIPRFGPSGAAWAVLIAYFISAIGTSFLYEATRDLGREQLWALITPWRATEKIS